MKNTYHRKGAQAGLSPPHLLISTGKRMKAKASKTSRSQSTGTTAPHQGLALQVLTHMGRMFSPPQPKLPTLQLNSPSALRLLSFKSCFIPSSFQQPFTPFSPVCSCLSCTGEPKRLLCYRQQRSTLITTKFHIPWHREEAPGNLSKQMAPKELKNAREIPAQPRSPWKSQQDKNMDPQDPW